jgi:hypothetical protein
MDFVNVFHGAMSEMHTGRSAGDLDRESHLAKKMRYYGSRGREVFVNDESSIT